MLPFSFTLMAEDILLFPEHKILGRLKELAQQIDKDYSSVCPVFVINLRSAFVTAADLIRYITIPVNIEFVCSTSYIGTETSGRISRSLELTGNISGRDIIIVEDIIDTGLTAKQLKEDLEKHSPASISLFTLLLRRGQNTVIPDYTAFEIDKGYVFGYGMDDALGCSRNLRDIRAYKE